MLPSKEEVLKLKETFRSLVKQENDFKESITRTLLLEVLERGGSIRFTNDTYLEAIDGPSYDTEDLATIVELVAEDPETLVLRVCRLGIDEIEDRYSFKTAFSAYKCLQRVCGLEGDPKFD